MDRTCHASIPAVPSPAPEVTATAGTFHRAPYEVFDNIKMDIREGKLLNNFEVARSAQ